MIKVKILLREVFVQSKAESSKEVEVRIAVMGQRKKI